MDHSQNLNHRMNTAKELAIEAGQIIQRARQNNNFTKDHKDHNELVTSTDREVDQFLINALSNAFPNDLFLTEESYTESEMMQLDFEHPTWVIDPIDGTVNFAYGHPQVAVSIALVINQKVQLGVVHCPFLAETFHAIKEQGAFLNDNPIHCQPCDQINQAIIASGLPYDKTQIEALLPNLNRAMLYGRDIRRNGSAAIDLCWVACGRLHAYFETVQPWDMAAGTLIAQEAGAHYSHYGKTDSNYGKTDSHKRSQRLIHDLKSKNLLICSPGITHEMQQLLK